MSNIITKKLISETDLIAAYDPLLIEQFKQQHQYMFTLVKQIHDTIQSEQYAAIPDLLRILSNAIEQHLIDEGGNFYNYLTGFIRLYDAGESDEIFSTMKHSMAKRLAEIKRFIHSYTLSGVTAENIAIFLKDLEFATQILTELTENEEQSLYTLYMPVPR